MTKGLSSEEPCEVKVSCTVRERRRGSQGSRRPQLARRTETPYRPRKSHDCYLRDSLIYLRYREYSNVLGTSQLGYFSLCSPIRQIIIGHHLDCSVFCLKMLLLDSKTIKHHMR